MNSINECLVCGSTAIQRIVRTEIFEYKGKKIPIEDYAVIHCNACEEDVAEPESRERSIPILRDAQRLIDNFLTSKAIKSIRKSFTMTQEQFGELLGGGEKAFARYETGKVLQSRPMDNLLRILSEHPETIDTLNKHATGSTTDCSIIISEKTLYNPKQNTKPFEYVITENSIRRVA
jgi:HTH-type transcriptional regulator/antitoxin MqsA